MQFNLLPVIFFSLISFNVFIQAKEAGPFPERHALRHRIQFWKKIYTNVTTSEGLLHDRNDLSIVYKRISVKGLSGRRLKRHLQQEKQTIKTLLLSIVRKRKQKLNDEERSLLWEVGTLTSLRQIKRLAREIRFQGGLSDRFYQGLVRSGKYIEWMKKEFRRQKMPEELAYLPHVESSFNYRAYSKVGAAGIWQFMRGTGKRFMTINYLVDERLDPIASTRAAIKLLKQNYQLLKSWSLAITAYNHGPASMRRAIRKVRSRNFVKILKNYRNRRFGFASHNFFPSFLAAVEIASSPERYFGKIKIVRPAIINQVLLSRRYTVAEISRFANISASQLGQSNLALKSILFTRGLRLPKGLVINLPVENGRYWAANKRRRSVNPVRKNPGKKVIHTVQRGESLYEISQIYNVSLMDLMVVNDIPRPSVITPGQKIRIPPQS